MFSNTHFSRFCPWLPTSLLGLVFSASVALPQTFSDPADSQLGISEPLPPAPSLANSLKPPTPINFFELDSQVWPRLCDQTTPNASGPLSVRFAQGVHWLTRSPQWLNGLETYTREALAYTQASTWPTIHERATQARVPVIMYHDILPEKEVFFDVTLEELEADFQLIQSAGLTPISLDDLVTHLQTGTSLPEKPIVLTFDDGYVGHYQRVFPLLKQYNYPAVFSVFTAKVDGEIVGRSTVTWEQLQEMAANPLITIASHSVTHPADLTQVSDAQLQQELVESKRLLEAKLGRPIQHFTYPEGHYDRRVAEAVAVAGYRTALTMDDFGSDFANSSESLLAIERFGQSELEQVIDRAWGGPSVAPWWSGFDFQAPVTAPQYLDIDDIPLILVSGGRPMTIHADSRYQVKDIIDGTEAIAAVDGGFFSLEFLDSNTMVGPILSQATGQFVPGNPGENPLLNGRPLVLMSPTTVRFVPFEADRHNTLAGIEAEMSEVTDAFVGAAWLVKNGEPQPFESFGRLFDFDAPRDRAFWGINQMGQPVIGVSRLPVDSITLGKVLAKAGLRDAVMLDSGASTSLAYQGESLMDYEPRPVPHVVALVPTVSPASTVSNVSQSATSPRTCILAQNPDLEN